MKNTLKNSQSLAEEIAKEIVEEINEFDRLIAAVTSANEACNAAMKVANAARAAKDEFVKRTEHDWPTDREVALAREIVRMSAGIERKKEMPDTSLNERALRLCKDLEDGEPFSRDVILRLVNALRSRGWD